MQVEFSSMKDFPPFLLLLAHPDEFHPGFSSGLDGIISYFTSLPCTAPQIHLSLRDSKSLRVSGRDSSDSLLPALAAPLGSSSVPFSAIFWASPLDSTYKKGTSGTDKTATLFSSRSSDSSTTSHPPLEGRCNIISYVHGSNFSHKNGVVCRPLPAVSGQITLH